MLSCSRMSLEQTTEKMASMSEPFQQVEFAGINKKRNALARVYLFESERNHYVMN